MILFHTYFYMGR